MAAPRVFVSSTCYDLADERDGLSQFCASFGFDTTLSERGDVFFHPDLHTHTSCVRETSNCHLFVLIIGGRFGGKYKADPGKSITNAEYAAAVQNGTPTFAFVKQDVLNDHNLWQRNKDKPFVKDIVYPSIDKQEFAEDIFKFVDAVRLAPVNNGMFGFRLGRDIYELLRKQWAGMMFDYLQNRSISKQLSLTNDALGNLGVVSSKIEELVKSIYRNIDITGAPQAIKTIENESLGEEFLVAAAQLLDDEKFIAETCFDDAEQLLPNDWWNFVSMYGWATVKTTKEPDGSESKIVYDLINRPIQKLSGLLNKNEEIKLEGLNKAYGNFRSLPPEVRRRLASRYFYTKKDSEEAIERIEQVQRTRAQRGGKSGQRGQDEI